MKRLIYRIKSILSSNSGETLMEGVVALLVLSTLLTTVTLMISTSLRWTGTFMREETDMQDAANAAVAERVYDTANGSVILNGTYDNGDPFTVTIPIQVINGSGDVFPFVSFGTP